MRRSRVLRWGPGVILIAVAAALLWRSDERFVPPVPSVPPTPSRPSVAEPRSAHTVSRPAPAAATENVESTAPIRRAVPGVALLDGEPLRWSEVQYGRDTDELGIVLTDDQGAFSIEESGTLWFRRAGCEDIVRELSTVTSSFSLEFSSRPPREPGGVWDSVGNRVLGTWFGPSADNGYAFCWGGGGLGFEDLDPRLWYWCFRENGLLSPSGLDGGSERAVSVPGRGVTFRVPDRTRGGWRLFVRNPGVSGWNASAASTERALTVVHEGDGRFEFLWQSGQDFDHDFYEVGPSGVSEVEIHPREERVHRVRFIDRWGYPVTNVRVASETDTEFATLPEPAPEPAYVVLRVGVNARSVEPMLERIAGREPWFELAADPFGEALFFYSNQGCGTVPVEELTEETIVLDGPAFVGVIEVAGADRIVLTSDYPRECELDGTGRYCIPYAGDPSGLVLEVYRGEELVQREAGRGNEYQRIRF